MESKVKKPKSKVRKIIEWVGTIILGVVFLFAAVCNVSKMVTRNEYGEGTAFGYSSYIVQTGSMEPVYPVGYAIFTYKETPESIVEKFNEIKDLNLEATDERNINVTFFDTYMNKQPSGFEQYTNQTNSNQSTVTNSVMTHQLFKITVDETKQEGEGKYLFFAHGINTEGTNSGENQYQVFTEKELIGVVKGSSKVVGVIGHFISSVWGLLICLLIPCLYIVITSVLDIFKACKDEEEPVTEGANENTTGNSIDNMSQDDYEKLKQEMINEMLNGKGDKK